MVRVWLRPCASVIAALGHRASHNALLRAPISCSLVVHDNASPFISGLRSLSSKRKDNKKDYKKSRFNKVEKDEDITELLDEAKYLSPEFDDKDLTYEVESDVEDEDEEDEDEEDEDDELSPADWAKKFEREVAEWDQDSVNFDEESNLASSDVEDDRLYLEMPGYDASLSLAESQFGTNEDEQDRDPFQHWDEGMAISPEMLNWMLPAEKRRPFKKDTTKPWKYFVAAKHQDIVELALDVDLLRLFISPTGRIRPRRFTGLKAKQQRQLAQAIKISRQLALLPYLSRYPEPSPEEWETIDAEIIAAAELDDDDDEDEDDDDDEDFDEDFEYD